MNGNVLAYFLPHRGHSSVLPKRNPSTMLTQKPIRRLVIGFFTPFLNLVIQPRIKN